MALKTQKMTKTAPPFCGNYMQCDWCGGKPCVFWDGEILCENCWKGVRLDIKREAKWKKWRAENAKTD